MSLVLAHRPIASTALPLAIDVNGIVPERLVGLATDAVARLPIRADGHDCRLGDLFAIAGDAGDGRLECRGDFSRVHQVAAGMTQGRVDVTGPVGRHAGSGMTGGTLRIAGHAGDWLAAGMAGGEVHVDGDAGDNAAAALPGEAAGMRGGLVVIHGSAGCLAGNRLRRGVVAIGGDCGAGAGLEMRAGTVVVGGRVGRHAGLGMRRGSLVFLAPGTPPEPDTKAAGTAWLPPGFTAGRTWSPAFLPLLLRRLERSGWAPAAAVFAGGWPGAGWKQWHGDVLAGGRGEIFYPACSRAGDAGRGLSPPRPAVS
jgi:formylmethanofuran dehydrogenase subunit C